MKGLDDIWNLIWRDIIFCLIVEVITLTPKTALSIADWPHKPTHVFSACFSSLARFPRNVSEGHPSKDYSKSSMLNCEVLMEWASKKKMHLVGIWSLSFQCDRFSCLEAASSRALPCLMHWRSLDESIN